ncbi:PD-(D/E)XK nuclease domain-containing protein [Acidaminococcus fermentans]|uniref:PD-(D/E)XK nuclease domain-containing protein n=1 Tax=Acidaminococcus fermentans TaxID=905 RepID=UPI003F8938A7
MENIIIVSNRVIYSVYDTANREAFYHGLLLGMTTLLGSEYEVKSNRERGLGRYDQAIYPTREGQCGVILELAHKYRAAAHHIHITCNSPGSFLYLLLQQEYLLFLR